MHTPPAFGFNHRDSLDESDRKAGKLDVGKFSWPFSPASRSNLTFQLISGLFPSDSFHYGTTFSANSCFIYVYFKGRDHPSKLIKMPLATRTCSDFSSVSVHTKVEVSSDIVIYLLYRENEHRWLSLLYIFDGKIYRYIIATPIDFSTNPY